MYTYTSVLYNFARIWNKVNFCMSFITYYCVLIFINKLDIVISPGNKENHKNSDFKKHLRQQYRYWDFLWTLINEHKHH